MCCPCLLVKDKILTKFLFFMSDYCNRRGQTSWALAPLHDGASFCPQDTYTPKESFFKYGSPKTKGLTVRLPT